MEQLTYKLEVFEGPLDLLLNLIERHKIDIYDIPIIEITDQYLAYVNAMEKEDLDLVSDFLVMAATLLEIKSRMLLPAQKDESGEEIDPRAELVERLIDYRRFKYISQMLGEKEEKNGENIAAKPRIPKEVAGYIPPVDLDALFEGVTAERLRSIFLDVMRRREETTDTIRSRFGVIKREKISLESRISSLLAYARSHKKFSFRQSLEKADSKMEVVVTFLAILELMKMGKILLSQEEAFADMEIECIDQDGVLPDLSKIEDK